MLLWLQWAKVWACGRVNT